MNYKVLLVEDNPTISKLIISKLEGENFHVTHAKNGQDAITQFQKLDFDIVLLDLYLPITSGQDVLRYIRQKSEVPVIIISVKADDIEKVINLSLGADDYLSKPFSVIELIARIKAVLRRSNAQSIKSSAECYRINDIIVNFNNYEVVKNGVAINLTSKEFDIFKLLISYPDKVFSKADIYRIVWREESSFDGNLINVHIRRLRQKIEDSSQKYEYVLTVWGFGYKIGKTPIILK